MTLLSMCMNLMQEQILEKVTWVASELGMNGDGNDEEVVKLSIEGKVTETPAGEDIFNYRRADTCYVISYSCWRIVGCDSFHFCNKILHFKLSFSYVPTIWLKSKYIFRALCYPQSVLNSKYENI